MDVHSKSSDAFWESTFDPNGPSQERLSPDHGSMQSSLSEDKD